ncbi:hypothetical protein [Pedobacter jeongneungensis]|uniref:hypothetical protein n=1 Tax=Pedobacter jeongneungensis TaxID=947309 RepID=UPI0004680057|nr:hypothetical protein [Pedobacter jeongneungensis]
MKNYLLLVIILTLLCSCQHSNYPYTEVESKAFLNDITKNARASITDLTEVKKQPADLFGIITRYPLSKKNQDEFNKNKGTIVAKDDDISDFATYTFKSYELTNEKNEKLKFIDNGRAVYLQKLALWDYDKVLSQNLGIEIKLNHKFNTLKGYIDMEFEMPDGTKKETKIPVDISVMDKIPE